MQETIPDGNWNPRGMPSLQIHQASRLLARVNEQRLRRVGIGVAHLPVIVALKDGSALSQKELTRLAGIEQPSMAQMLARMERDGLIQRSTDPRDRRSSLVSLTRRTLELLPQGRAILSQVNEEALNGFSARERETLVTLLDRLMMNLDSLAKGETSETGCP